MTTERKIEIMNAFLEGKEIEFALKETCPPEWIEISGEPIWNWENCSYRIKDEYVPFDISDGRKIIGAFITNGKNYFTVVIDVSESMEIQTGAGDVFSFKEALEEFTFLDGTPFGKRI